MKFLRYATLMLVLAVPLSSVSNADLIYNLQVLPGSGDSIAASTDIMLASNVTGSTGFDLDASETYSTYGFDVNTVSTVFSAGTGIRVEHVPSPLDDVDSEAEFDQGYFEIFVQADPGFLLDLDDITFESVRATGGATLRGVEVFSTVNGDPFVFGSSTQIVNIDNIVPNRGSGPGSAQLVTGDLTGAEFQGVSSVTFRFYGTNQSTGGIEFANFSINGTVVDNSTTLLGDVNLSGTVDFLDISPFISLLSTGDFLAEADINRDGAVDFLDIAPFINILSGP